MVDYKREHWVECYRTALLELDDDNLQKRIEEARRAMQKRLLELFRSPNSSDERQALEDASSALRVLSRRARLPERKT